MSIRQWNELGEPVDGKLSIIMRCDSGKHEGKDTEEKMLIVRDSVIELQEVMNRVGVATFSVKDCPEH